MPKLPPRVLGALALCCLLGASDVAHATIQINSPNGGESFEEGETVVIQWEVIAPFPTQDWDLYYSTSSASGPWTTLALNVPTSGSIWAGSTHTYSWTLPMAAVAPTVWVRVVQDNSGLDFEDVTNGPFEVVGLTAPFLRGDGNGDGVLDIADAVFALAALFIAGSPESTCSDAVDSNDDGAFDISDPVSTLATLFIAGTPPLPAPATGCGPDPTDDALECAAYGSCP